MKVIILIGLPGSGKSTWINRYYPNNEVSVCSADNFFMVDGEYKFDPTQLPAAHADCFKSFICALDCEINTVIVDNTNILYVHRQPYTDAALMAGYEVVFKFFPCDVATSVKRNTHGVPEHTIQRMYDSLTEQGFNK